MLPSFALYIKFNKKFGNSSTKIVKGIPITKEKIIACLITFFTPFLLWLAWNLLTLGIMACEIAIVKKDGNSNNGKTYPFNTPYSWIINSLEYPILRRTVVNIMGSKKDPIFPIILLPVVYKFHKQLL